MTRRLPADDLWKDPSSSQSLTSSIVYKGSLLLTQQVTVWKDPSSSQYLTSSYSYKGSMLLDLFLSYQDQWISWTRHLG